MQDKRCCERARLELRDGAPDPKSGGQEMDLISHVFTLLKFSLPEARQKGKATSDRRATNNDNDDDDDDDDIKQRKLRQLNPPVTRARHDDDDDFCHTCETHGGTTRNRQRKHTKGANCEFYTWRTRNLLLYRHEWAGAHVTCLGARGSLVSGM